MTPRTRLECTKGGQRLVAAPAKDRLLLVLAGFAQAGAPGERLMRITTHSRTGAVTEIDSRRFELRA